MELRDYQKEAKNQARNSFLRNKRVICALPTGGGKTVIASSIIKDALNRGSKVCIIVHRIEILKQFYKALREFDINIINFVVSEVTRRQLTEEGCHGLFEKRLKQVNLCMVETFHRRYSKHYHDLDVDFYVMDEIHWGSYRKLCHEANNAFILGFTATPKATSRVEPLNTYFDDIVVPVTVKDLIKKKFLVKGRTFSINYNFKGLKVRMGEFTESSLLQEFKRPRLFKGVVQNYLEHANGLRAICYNVNVEHSKLVCSEFNERGINAVHVDGTTPPEERARIFRDYEEGRADILCNVGVATTGYDNPATRCIIENRATMQLTLHHQMLGRGARPITNPLVEPKNEFIIIDMGRNYMRHGLYGEDVDWKEIFHDPSVSENKNEDKKLIECPECGAIIKASLIKCSYCDNERTPKEVSESLMGFMDTEEIKEFRRANLPSYLRGKKFSEMNDAELKQYGDLMGYKKNWFWAIRKKVRR